MEAIIKNIQEGYRNGLKRAMTTSDLICPFCEEEDFDSKGLKMHLSFGWCDNYNKLDISNER